VTELADQRPTQAGHHHEQEIIQQEIIEQEIVGRSLE